MTKIEDAVMNMAHCLRSKSINLPSTTLEAFCNRELFKADRGTVVFATVVQMVLGI